MTSKDILKNTTFRGSEWGLDKAATSRGPIALGWMGSSRKIPPSLNRGVLLG